MEELCLKDWFDTVEVLKTCVWLKERFTLDASQNNVSIFYTLTLPPSRYNERALTQVISAVRTASNMCTLRVEYCPHIFGAKRSRSLVERIAKLRVLLDVLCEKRVHNVRLRGNGIHVARAWYASREGWLIE